MGRPRYVTEIASVAAEFKLRLQEAKANNSADGFDWYPYDSLGVFTFLTSTLTGEHRDLDSLRGAAPLLDIGCGDGDLSFFFESIGWPVVAIDNPGPNYNRARGFRMLHGAFGSNVEFQMADIDRELPLRGRTFGLALCLGVLYHLKSPYSVLEELSRHARYCILSTRVAQVTTGGTAITHEPVAYLLDPFETNNDPSNFWIFSPAGLKRIIDRTGWDLCGYTTAGVEQGATPSGPDYDQRIYCLIRSKRADPWMGVDLDGGWHNLEQDSWRWTSRVFRVRLRGPFYGGRLSFRFLIPPAILDSTGPLHLTAVAGEHRLNTQTYAAPGEHIYEATIPATLLNEETLVLTFDLDKCWGPTASDPRELGLQVVFWDLTPSTPAPRTPITID